jgi:hypothetical protein
MAVRGNKRPGVIATVLFGLIIVTTVAVAWFAIRGFRKEPSGPPIGSQALPGQAAQRAGAEPRQNPALADVPPR